MYKWNIWYYPFRVYHLVVFYLCLTLDTMFTLSDCLPHPLSPFFYSLLFEHILTHSWEALYFIVTFRPLLRIMSVFVHVCMYLYLMGVSWPSLVFGVPAVWPSVESESSHTFSVASSLKFPHHLNDMSLYWIHGYIDIQVENTLKDRLTVVWSRCLPLGVTCLEKYLPKVSPTFVVVVVVVFFS